MTTGSKGFKVSHLIAEEVILLQKQGLQSFIDEFSSEYIIPLIDCYLQTLGVAFFSGVGKSGFVARKIVATLQSFGEKAFFLNPSDVLHGDLGVVGEGDLVCLFSNSGETLELVAQVPFFQKRGATVCVVTSRLYSKLALLADRVVTLPVAKELDSFGMAPTTSTQYQLFLGDCLAATVARIRGFSLEDFAKNHPSGKIGIMSNKTVQDVMIPFDRVPKALPSLLLKNALEIISEYACGCICVADQEDHLLGIFTDGDLRRTLKKLGKDALEAPLEEIMIKKPRVVLQSALLSEALEDMEAGSPITALPVVESLHAPKIKGLLHMHTLIRAGIL